MSEVVGRLRERRVTRIDAPAAAAEGSRAAANETRARRRLSRLRRGEQAEILAMDDTLDAATARRLIDLGFAPGTHVEMVRAAPLGGPVILRVADYEIAIRRELARRVEVRPTPFGTSRGNEPGAPARTAGEETR